MKPKIILTLYTLCLSLHINGIELIIPENMQTVPIEISVEDVTSEYSIINNEYFYYRFSIKNHSEYEVKALFDKLNSEPIQTTQYKHKLYQNLGMFLGICSLTAGALYYLKTEIPVFQKNNFEYGKISEGTESNWDNIEYEILRNRPKYVSIPTIPLVGACGIIALINTLYTITSDLTQDLYKENITLNQQKLWGVYHEHDSFNPLYTYYSNPDKKTTIIVTKKTIDKVNIHINFKNYKKNSHYILTFYEAF
ncbi:hypothetical protein EBR77_00180 [bacterium]|nr:hypothetical protein [bacterium]NBX78602.1 hypothetical protein [bacterium]